jgi:uncharacterized repeat protein (TIGR03803 family)
MIGLFCAAIIATTVTAQAQTFTALHAFTGSGDGGVPYSGLVMDRAGNLYGTTAFGGPLGSCFDGGGCGTVYKLTHRGSGWVLNTLYSFRGGQDGAFPASRVIIGPDGNLYGTTAGGGGSNCTGEFYSGCGTVFKLTPHPTVCTAVDCPWIETVLYRFTGGADGANPFLGKLIFDQSGNLYGTTSTGGFTGNSCNTGCGVVFELSPTQSGWTQTVLHTFTGAPDGKEPLGSLTFDSEGNLYGTTALAGHPPYGGTVYELSPSASGWNETVLVSLNQGYVGNTSPYGGVIFDNAGNLYGTGEAVYGAVWELMPGSGGWTLNTLYNLPGSADNLGGPYDSLIMDGSGDLYGTTYAGGTQFFGTAFELSPANGGGWNYTPLHEFGVYDCGTDGCDPIGGLVQDANGNLYGTASTGGTNDYGVIFEITPQ